MALVEKVEIVGLRKTKLDISIGASNVANILCNSRTVAFHTN